jgi:hypothetical protein
MAKSKFDKLMEMLPKQKDYVTDYPKLDTLDAIAQVETGNGKYMDHKPVEGSMHKGSSAIGKYGIMPSTIKETEKSLSKFSDDQIRKKISKDPELEEKIASKYYDRLREQLGTNDPEAIGYGWLQGISGAKRDLKEGKDISEHWHVKKIRNAYNNPLDDEQEPKVIERLPASEFEDEDESETPSQYKEEKPSIGDRISDLATEYFEKIDPSMMRMNRIEEKEAEKQKALEEKEFQEFLKARKERAEATRKKILERKD